MLCWGSTKHGQLGLGGIEDEVIISPVENKYFANKARLKQVACGVNHTSFLLDDGTVYTCGNNDCEQLGHDGPMRRPEQVAALEAQFITQIGAGHSFCVALNNKGQLFCWGAISGQVDDDYFYPRPSLLRNAPDKPIVQFACGYYSIILLTEDGKVYVMGKNTYGQLGLGNKQSTPYPVYLQSIQGLPVMQVASGSYHSIVLTVSGNIFAFGRNDFGQLGLGDTEDRIYPLNVKSMSHLKACYVSCGENFSAILTKDGGVFTFGAGSYGQLGHNSTSHEYLPRKVADLMGSEVTQIACGRCHVLVYLSGSNRLYSFGLGGSGQLGIGLANLNKTGPTPVKSDLIHSKTGANGEKKPSVYEISCGGDQSFVITSLASETRQPIDHRSGAKQHQILNADIIEKFERKPITQPVYKDNTSHVTSVAILNPTHLKEIETIFGSTSCLNASFLDAQSHYNTSNRYPGVDMAKVTLVRNALNELNDSYLNESIIKMLTRVYESLPESPPSIEALRLYITTPFLTEFDKYNTSEHLVHSLLQAFAQSINKLKKEAAGRVVDYWFAWTGVEFLTRLVNLYRTIVISIISSKPPTDAGNEFMQKNAMLRTSMLFLQKLHKINLEFREIVPYDSFYIPELVEKIDIKKDYFEWLRRRNLRSDSVLFCDYPFVFDARAKTLLLQTDADLQMQMALQEAVTQNINSIFLPTIDPVNPLLALFVRRDHIVQDTLNQLSKQKRDDLKKPLKVMFIGEDAYDAGGVKKEFFMLLLREILDLKYGMFIHYEETNTIWFNDQTLEGSDMYHLIGELCGLAIYNSIIIDLPFPLVLYKKLLKEPPTLQDMYTLSPSVARSLDSLLKYEGDDFESMFNLTFEITRQRFDQTVTVELIENGSKIPVTKDNCKQYVNAYIDYIFNKSVEIPFNAFSQGFHYVCGSKVLELFHASELMAMVVGNQNYDFDELERNAEYKGEYGPEHPVIKRFWKVFHSLTLDEKKKFLTFLTGTDRIPILGMKRVKIYIQSTKGGDSFFPVAHTCFNLLDLPEYSTEEILRDKLKTAIEYTQGFTLV